MKKIISMSLVSALMSVGAVLSYAADTGEAAKLKKQLSDTLKGSTISDVKPSPIPGLYEVVINTRIVHVTPDGKYLLTGDLIDLPNRTNISENKRGKLITEAIDQLGDKNMIVMSPAKAKRTVTVFTDVDCPYCAKLHLDVPELNKAGVKVRYLLYPRNGIQSETYQTSVSVWCARDRVKAVGIAKAGGKVEAKTCDNPVKQHYELGQHIGITGTPTIVLDDGSIMPGYVPPQALLQHLGLGGANVGRAGQ